MTSRLIYLTDDDLSFLKQSWLHFETPSWQEGVYLIDEVRRLRAELARYKTPNVDNVTIKGEVK